MADCCDAMISDRPYRKGVPKNTVVEMLKARSGTQFDPRVIDVFADVCSEDESLSAELSPQLVEQ